MSVCPLDWRYGSNEMRELFSRTHLLKTMLKVEITLLEALAEVGMMDPREVASVNQVSSTVTLEEVDEMEKKTGHDVMAMAVVLAEKAGEAGKLVHYGATSYDIVDTAYSLIFRDALLLLETKLLRSLDFLSSLAQKYMETIMVGRTHGQHALPITLGFKMANYVYELSRSLERLEELKTRLLKIKMAGAVGTGAGWGKNWISIQREVSRRLGLPVHEISTQIAPRDGHAELICQLAILGSQLERFALEVRELMRPEIGELAEAAESRVGSSTMPQKENPVISEKICGLSKVLRGMVVPALENIPTWHERDLTNSSSERIMISHSLMIIDEIVDSFDELLRGLRVNEERMIQNLDLTKGGIMGESLMLLLTRKGLPRHMAHNIVSALTKTVRNDGISLYEAAIREPKVTSLVTEQELNLALSPKNYLGAYKELIERAIRYYKVVKERIFAAVAQR